MSRFGLKDERGFNQIYVPVGSTPLRMRRRGNWIVDQIKKVGARRVLEIGSGTGENAAFLARNSTADIVAVDISPNFVADACARHSEPNLRFEVFDLLGERPMNFGQFDLVCGNGILHHLVRKLPEVLVSLRGFSNPNGRLAFIEPNYLNPYCAFIFGTAIGRKVANLEPDEMAFTRRQLLNELTKAGWREVHVETRDFLLPGLPEFLIKPSLALEPVLEATALTQWLAQSHFMTAQA